VEAAEVLVPEPELPVEPFCEQAAKARVSRNTDERSRRLCFIFRRSPLRENWMSFHLKAWRQQRAARSDCSEMMKLSSLLYGKKTSPRPIASSRDSPCRNLTTIFA
jgi:hypothetical protein